MESSCEVLILCGGEGKRLRSMISKVPKPMAPIGEKPFLDYLVRTIEKQGFKNFCFLTGYKSEIIVDYFQRHFSHLNLRFSVEETPLGTGGAIVKAIQNTDINNFLVVNGDTFFDIDLSGFESTWKPGTFKIALRIVNDVARYGKVEVTENGQITSFVEKTALTGNTAGLINGGIYYFSRELLMQAVTLGTFISLEQEMFPIILKSGKMYSQVFTDDFIDIGIPEDYIRAKVLIENWANRPR